MTDATRSDTGHCHVCGLVRATPPERVLLRDDAFTAVTLEGREGWVMWMTNRHGAWLWDLSAEEAAGLGPTLGRLTGAMRDVLAASHIYYLGLGENSLHLHGLLIPRDEPFGRGVQAVLRSAMSSTGDGDRALPTADRLRAQLSGP